MATNATLLVAAILGAVLMIWLQAPPYAIVAFVLLVGIMPSR